MRPCRVGGKETRREGVRLPSLANIPPNPGRKVKALDIDEPVYTFS